MTGQDIEPTTRIRWDHPKTFLLLAFLAAVDLLMVWGLSSGNLGKRHSVLYVSALWLCVSFLTLLLAVRIPQWLDRRPAIEISKSGMVATDISPDIIPWEQIVDIEAIKRGNYDVIEVRLEADFVSTMRLSRLHRLARAKSTDPKTVSYYVATRLLERDAPYIMAHVGSYRDDWIARSRAT